MWKKAAAEFADKWNFPNCCGAIDGKHCVMKAPPSAGSLFYNYKGTHSIVLMAIVDANCRFMVVDIGPYGRSSDGGTFANSTFGRALQNGSVQLLHDSVIRGVGAMPHVIVGDEAFPLKTYLMRPYPGRGLTDGERSFNYRLSRARRVSENAFGILASRWRIFHRTMEQRPNTVDQIVKATVVLHNFLMRDQHRDNYIETCDQQTGDLPVGGTADDNGTAFHQLQRMRGCRASRQAFEVRNNFRDYFLSDAGKLPWQAAK
jgi:hypothetical protein